MEDKCALGLNGFSSNSAASLCSFFAAILTWSEPSSPLDIYKEAMAEDFINNQAMQIWNLMVTFLTWFLMTWPPILISHLFQHGHFYILGRNFFTPGCFSWD